MSESLMEIPECDCGIKMKLRPDSQMTPEQKFCGAWYDAQCPEHKFTSVLFASDEFEQFLHEQRTHTGRFADEATEGQQEIF